MMIKGMVTALGILLLTALSISAQEIIQWTTQADFLRGKHGRQIIFICPANGTASGRLWGSGVYTDDSSICTAAVHAGYVTLRGGGVVTIEVQPGREFYASTSRNGITSQAYDFWPGSFVVVRESKYDRWLAVAGAKPTPQSTCNAGFGCVRPHIINCFELMR